MRFTGTAASPEQSLDAEVGGEVAEALEVVGGGEAVQERQRRGHPARQRLIGGIAQQRVQPEEPARPALDLEQFPGQQLGVQPRTDREALDGDGRTLGAADPDRVDTDSAGCRDLEVVTASYNTLADARNAGAISGGWLPEGLPPGTTDVREAHNPDTNARWGLFNFPVAQAPALKALLEPSEFSVSGQECRPPRRIEWWPILLRGALDAEAVKAAGLKSYRSRDGALIFVLNWTQGRAYYWSAPVIDGHGRSGG